MDGKLFPRKKRGKVRMESKVYIYGSYKSEPANAIGTKTRTTASSRARCAFRAPTTETAIAGRCAVAVRLLFNDKLPIFDYQFSISDFRFRILCNARSSYFHIATQFRPELRMCENCELRFIEVINTRGRKTISKQTLLVFFIVFCVASSVADPLGMLPRKRLEYDKKSVAIFVYSLFYDP